MSHWNNPPPLSTPQAFVQSGWDWFRTLGAQWITASQQSITDLGVFDITPVVFSGELDLTVDYGTFIRPPPPDKPILGDVDVTVPPAPPFEEVTITALGPAPTEPDFTGLSYNKPGAPPDPMPPTPTDLAVTLDPIVLPPAPVVDLGALELPDMEPLFPIVIPPPPDTSVVAFTAPRPTVDLTPWLPDASFNWQEVAYSSTLLDSLKAHIQSMMDGGLGLPPAVEQALFDRGRARGDLLAIKRVQERADELAARGLVEPSGYLARRLDEARQDGRTEAAGLNRDITIKVAEIEVESIRFAIAQAGALELALMQQNGEINARALQAAKVASDIQIAVFNAMVSKFNLDVEVYKADAEVYRSLIAAAQAKADVYKAEIEGQKVIGEVNQSLIQSYVAQVQAVSTMIGIYTAQLEGAKVLSQLNTQKLEQTRLKVQVFSEQVGAWKTQWDAYGTQVQAELGNVKVYEAIGGVYGQRVEAFRTKGQAYFQEGQFKLASQGLEMQAYGANLDGVKTLIAAQSASIDAKARTFGAEAEIYKATADVAATESAAFGRDAALRVEVARAKADLSMKNAEAHINQNIQISSLYVEQLKAKAQVISQLAASTMSGMSFGANFNGTLNANSSYGLDYSYSGDTTGTSTHPYIPSPNF